MNANHFYSSQLTHHQAKDWTKIKQYGYMCHYGFSDFSIFFNYMVWQHGNSFLKIIISSYDFPSFFRYLILKLEKLRQPVKIFWDNHFLHRFSPPPDQCWWVCKLQQHHAADKLLTHNIDIGEGEGVLMELTLSFLREKRNNLCLIELSQKFCDWL